MDCSEKRWYGVSVEVEVSGRVVTEEVLVSGYDFTDVEGKVGLYYKGSEVKMVKCRVTQVDEVTGYTELDGSETWWQVKLEAYGVDERTGATKVIEKHVHLMAGDDVRLVVEASQKQWCSGSVDGCEVVEVKKMRYVGIVL